MKKSFSYSILLLLSLVMFGCGGTTIDMESDEYQDIEFSEGFVTYKGNPFNGALVEYYENGQLQEKSKFKDGKQHGVFESYYKSGQLEVKAYFKNGKVDGVSKEYYENGKLEEEKKWKDGKEIPMD